ncbi:hypothetical protein RhiirA1_482040, partial [Rhizophagus irregularis]
EVDSFWDRIKQIFIFNKNTKVYVSDSHVLSYDIAKKFQCTDIYLFDAHSDLGYGGSLSLDVNCANWLGFLLKEQVVKSANIIYSPFTKEKPEFFKHYNRVFDIKYLEIQDLHNKVNTAVIHICRSGAWTPPWYDQNFVKFLNALGLEYQVINCPLEFIEQTIFKGVCFMNKDSIPESKKVFADLPPQEKPDMVDSENISLFDLHEDMQTVDAIPIVELNKRVKTEGDELLEEVWRKESPDEKKHS